MHDSIDKYLSGIPNGKRITIHHLLNHSSGLYNAWPPSSPPSVRASLTSIVDQISKQPLALWNTGNDHHSKILPQRATDHTYNHELVQADYIDMSITIGAGSLYSTVEDLFKWSQALFKGHILNEESLQQMLTASIKNSCYGLFISEDRIMDKQYRKIGHLGQVSGFISALDRYTDEDITVILLSNNESIPLDTIKHHIAQLLFGSQVKANDMN